MMWCSGGPLTPIRRGGEVIPASEYREPENQVREPQGMLGKTMENEIYERPSCAWQVPKNSLAHDLRPKKIWSGESRR